MVETKAGQLNFMQYAKEVGINDFCQTSEPVCTIGLTTCVGMVAVGDKRAVIGHFSDIGRRGMGRERFVESILQSVQIGASKIILAGAAPYIENDVDTVAIDRIWATAYLMSKAQAFSTYWSEAGKAVDIAVDPSADTPVTMYGHDRM